MSGRECDLCSLELSDDFKVGQCPDVPSFVPCGIESRGDLVIADQLCWIPLSMSVGPLLQQKGALTGSSSDLMLACQSPSST